MTDNKEPKAEEIEKAEDSPKWAVELAAKFDKMADAFSRFTEATVKKQEEEEEKPEEEEKQEEEEEEEKPEDKKKQDEEEEEPKEEEKQDEEEEEEPEEEKKVDIEKMVAEGIKKALAQVSEKKSKVPKEVDEVLTYSKISKMSWKEVNDAARKLGAR